MDCCHRGNVQPEGAVLRRLQSAINTSGRRSRRPRRARRRHHALLAGVAAAVLVFAALAVTAQVAVGSATITAAGSGAQPQAAPVLVATPATCTGWFRPQTPRRVTADRGHSSRQHSGRCRGNLSSSD
jgi:hypothetical protein